MADAVALMKDRMGYRVHFEKREGAILASDYFPERDEPSIQNVEEAWDLAEKFASIDPSRYVNVYVVQAFDWVPVPDYNKRALNRYPPAQTASKKE
jgi:hypothetical protein